MANVTMTLEEYEALRSLINSERESEGESLTLRNEQLPLKSKKRTTAYGRKYKKAFKMVSKRFKLKSGKWKKNGFRSAVKAAHKEARK